MTYPDDTDGRRGRRGPFNVAFGSFSKILDSGLYPVPFRGTVMVGQAAPPTKTGMGTTVNSVLCIVFRVSYQCLTLAVCAVDDRVLIMPTDCMIFTLSVNSYICWLINTCCCIYIKFCLCPLGPVLGLENQPPCIQRIKNKICDTDCGKCTTVLQVVGVYGGYKDLLGGDRAWAGCSQKMGRESKLRRVGVSKVY